MEKDKRFIIDLEGKIHYCNPNNRFNGHEELAIKLLNKKDCPYACYELADKGAVFVGGLCIRYYSGLFPNQSQINTLFDLRIQYITNINDIYGDNWKIY